MANHRAGLTKFVIHASLVKPMMFLGGERTLVIIAMMISGYMGYLISMRYSLLWGAVVGIGLWTGLMLGLRSMADADPQMWSVVRRAKRYAAFYPAHGRLDAALPAIRDPK